MKNIEILLTTLFLFQGCGSETQQENQFGGPGEPEEIITFEKDIENSKSSDRKRSRHVSSSYNSRWYEKL